MKKTKPKNLNGDSENTKMTKSFCGKEVALFVESFLQKIEDIMLAENSKGFQLCFKSMERHAVETLAADVVLNDIERMCTRPCDMA